MARAKDESNSKKGTRFASYAKIQNILGVKSSGPIDYEMIFRHAAEYLQGSDEQGDIEIGLGMKEEKQSWVLSLHEKGFNVSKGSSRKPRLEILVKSEAFRKIAGGKVSPIYAMAKGELRVRGDLEYGKHIYRLLAADKGRIDPCE